MKLKDKLREILKGKCFYKDLAENQALKQILEAVRDVVPEKRKIKKKVKGPELLQYVESLGYNACRQTMLEKL